MYGVPLRFDPALVRRVVADLAPERARVLWASKELEVRARVQTFINSYC